MSDVKTPTICVSSRAFALVAPYRATHDIRYYLNGVFVTPHPGGKGVLLAGTNGHQLAMVYDEHGEASEPFIMACENELARVTARFRTGWVKLVDGRAHLHTNEGMELYIQPGSAIVAGKFPNVYRVLPREPEKLKPLLQGQFSHHLMSRLLSTGAQIAGRRGFCGLTHWQDPENPSQLLTRFSDEPNMLVVTMPLRIEASTSCMPPLIAQAKAQAEKAAA